MKILFYAFKRLLQGIPTLLGLIIIVFFLSKVIPADPAAAIAGDNATPAQIAAIKKRYGFDQPLHVQFYMYLSKLSHGDLGVSAWTNRAVMEELKRRLPPTLELVGAAVAISVLLGVPLGMIAAVRRNSWIDHGVRAATIGGLAIASFWLGIMLQLVLSLAIDLFPLGGQMTSKTPPHVTGFMVIDSILALKGKLLLDALWHLVLPAFTLCMPGLATIARFTRSGFLGVLQNDYIAYSRSMGLPPKVILCKYVLKNAIVATLTQIGLIVGVLLAGTVVVEYIFFWPGIGAFMIDVILCFDYDGILGATLFIGFAILIINIIVDILQMFVDPRIVNTL